MYKTECNATIALDPEIAYNYVKGIKMVNDLCLNVGQCVLLNIPVSK